MVDNQKELRAYILELSLNSLEFDLDERIEKLQKIYSDDFRHFYSELFTTVTLIKNDEKYDLQTLLENIGMIFEGIKNKYDDPNDSDISDEFFKKVKKLYDHINLDIARFNYISTVASTLEQKLQKNNEELQNKMQRDYVTILGIFAAILITFVSSMAFSTSVLNNIDKVNVHHLTFIMTLIAFLLFNLLNLLLNFLAKINKINTNGTNWFIGVINTVLIIALIIDTFLWYNAQP